MQPLDLYAIIEQDLDFSEEIYHLHKSIATIVLSLAPNSHIDIGCGQGDFCQYIQSHGIQTFGVDLSEKQIEIAKTKGIEAETLDIKDCKQSFECATAIFDVINYFSKKELGNFLNSIYNLLLPNGYFIFDCNTLYGFEEVAQGTLTLDKKEKFIAIDANFEEDCLYTDITLFEKNPQNCYTKTQGTIQQFYHSSKELKKMISQSGFIVEKMIDFHLHSQEKSDKQIFICKKEK